MPPHRRQSFAPTSKSAGSRQGLGRRAQSLVPSDTARQLVPRKSILKSTAFTFNAEPGPPPRLQSEPPQFYHNNADDPENDLADDVTADYRAEISDNTTRRSIGRRVSFANLIHYRVFESNDNTNSSGAPSSSPSPASQAEPQQSPPPAPLPKPQLSNENDYPGRRINNVTQARFSMASDYGERSMSLDMDQESDDISEPPTDPVFFPAPTSDNVEPGPPATEEEYDEGSDEDDEDDGEMEITEAIALNINRKRSLSVAQQQDIAKRSSISLLASSRRSSVKFIPSAQSKPKEEEDEDEDGESGKDLTTNTQATQESDAPMEFTMPLEMPLKEPKPPSNSWLALQAVANGHHSQADEEDNEMELTSALTRLQNARASLDVGGQAGDGDDNNAYDDPSFTSTESSMNDSTDIGDRTLNVTNLMGRVSNIDISSANLDDIAGTVNDDYTRPSESIAPLNIQRKAAPTSSSNVPRVFSAPRSSVESTTTQTSAVHGSEIGRLQSLATAKGLEPSPSSQLRPPMSTPVFSAPQSSPSRIPVPSSPAKVKQPLASMSPAVKRSAPPQDAEKTDPQPSPAKKRTLENNSIAPLLQSQTVNRQSVQLDPAVRSMNEDSSVPPAAPRPSLGGMRRPSGYFAQRRSLAPGTSGYRSVTASPAPENQNKMLAENSQVRRASIATVPAKEYAQVGDGNTLAPTSVPNVTSEPGLARLTPMVIVTSDTTQENIGGLDDMEMDTEEQERTGKPRLNDTIEFSEFETEQPEDVPSISIEEFFLVTGIKFHEHTVPRRSTIHPSQLHRRDSNVAPSMTEYAKAMAVHIPQHELYRWVTQDLQTFIDNIKRIYREAEDEVAKVTPVLFREFSQASEEGRTQLLHQLKLIKANRHSAARGSWYEIRYRWTKNLLENIDKGYAGLEKDRIVLTEIVKSLKALLPSVQKECVEIEREYERERTELEEVTNSDPQFLEELKATIDEQNQIIEAYKVDEAEGTAKLERLDAKLEELEAQRRENLQAIETAERKITLNKSSTRAEVLRLQDELECLQILHSWRATKITQHKIELMFTDQFLVVVPCVKCRPISEKIVVTRLEATKGLKRPKRVDYFPLFSELAIDQAQIHVRRSRCTSIKRVVEILGDFWTSCSQLRKQFTFLAIKYPVILESLRPQNGSELYAGLKFIASILLHRHKAKVLVAFLFNNEILARFPFTLRKLQCEVKVAYGHIDPGEFRDAIMTRLGEASVEDNHACLLDACVEAASRYE